MYWYSLVYCRSVVPLSLNSNIRCIEISLYIPIILINSGWIVTLDVLKWGYGVPDFAKKASWIVTLDVLKLKTPNIDSQLHNVE